MVELDSKPYGWRLAGYQKTKKEGNFSFASFALGKQLYMNLESYRNFCRFHSSKLLCIALEKHFGSVK